MPQPPPDAAPAPPPSPDASPDAAPPPLEVLELTVPGPGPGKILVRSSSGEQESCTPLGGGALCTFTFPMGEAVRLVPFGGAFLGFTGDCEGVDACTVTMDRARGVRAAFGD